MNWTYLHLIKSYNDLSGFILIFYEWIGKWQALIISLVIFPTLIRQIDRFWLACRTLIHSDIQWDSHSRLLILIQIAHQPCNYFWQCLPKSTSHESCLHLLRDFLREDLCRNRLIETNCFHHFLRSVTYRMYVCHHPKYVERYTNNDELEGNSCLYTSLKTLNRRHSQEQ